VRRPDAIGIGPVWLFEFVQALRHFEMHATARMKRFIIRFL